MKNQNRRIWLNRLGAFALCFVMLSVLFLPYFTLAEETSAEGASTEETSAKGTSAEEISVEETSAGETPAGEKPGKTVRVGWYDSSFNTMDKTGRRSGYGYEYQMKIASYAGWNYEYVTGSWSDLMEMLENGEIDMLSDVSYKPEREEKMLYPLLPMGTEEYYLFMAPGNSEISSSDYSTLNGKRVGVNKGSIQTDFYQEWAEQNGVDAELIEVTCTEDESLSMLERGDLDAYVTVDSFVNPERAVPACKVGSSDFYFAVSKSRPDLLSDLNNAMSRVQDEDRYFNQKMFEKYIRRTGANAFLPAEEVDWLSSHGPIRVGYQDNYLAFCAADRQTGELIGILKDYLAYAADCIVNVHIDFETIAYPTVSDALDALERGEIDCVFPANLNTYDGEELDLILTQPLISTDLYAVVRQSEQKYFYQKEHVIVAVNEGNQNYDAVLAEFFPEWRRVYYPTTEDCLLAVRDGVADCVLISNYRYNNVARECEKYRLTTLTTGIDIDYCFAVSLGDTEVYSIMSKIVSQVPSSTVNGALSYYFAEDARVTFIDFIVDHLTIVLIVAAAVLLVIFVLLVQNMRAVKKARQLISATEYDDLTGLYNRSFFFQYANRMRREHPEIPMDAIVLNIEQFHSVNALYGREFGDQVLRSLGKELKAIADEEHGIAGRFEADRFDICCRQTKDYQKIFDRLQKKLDEMAPNTSIRLRMGVMPWQEKTEPVQQFDMARTACSMARGHFKEHLIVFNDEIRRQEMFEQRLLNDLRHALDSYEFEVYYQPKFNIQYEPPRLVSAEALVRWRHPELGMISPADFIPLFEKNGQVSMIDKYVWAETAKQIARWRDLYGITIPVSVNLSRVDVFDPTLEDTLDGILRFSGLGRDILKLEVTESTYTENSDQVIQVVKSLREKGYEVEMDDFGTGYSSLSMLSAMPVDVLKMDRAFVRNIDQEEKDKQLVALILDIAANLKIPVVAEGVETREQLELLKELGCELVQGYYFSRPLQAVDFEAAYISGRKPER